MKPETRIRRMVRAVRMVKRAQAVLRIARKVLNQEFERATAKPRGGRASW